MRDDYLKKFKKLSNVELLKMRKNANEFEIEAIEVANEVLQERIVSESEEQEVELYFKSIEAKEIEKKEQFNSYKKLITDLFEPLVVNGTEPSTSKWLNSFLILISIQFIWYLYESIFSLLSFNDSFSSMFNILTLVYISIVFYLLYKRKRWGWILLFGEKLITALSSLVLLIIFINEPFLFELNLNEFLWPFIISMFYLNFLWRPEIISFFDISRLDKIKYAKRVIVISLLIGVLIVSVS